MTLEAADKALKQLLQGARLRGAVLPAAGSPPQRCAALQEAGGMDAELPAYHRPQCEQPLGIVSAELAAADAASLYCSIYTAAVITVTLKRCNAGYNVGTDGDSLCALLRTSDVWRVVPFVT